MRMILVVLLAFGFGVGAEFSNDSLSAEDAQAIREVEQERKQEDIKRAKRSRAVREAVSATMNNSRAATDLRLAGGLGLLGMAANGVAVYLAYEGSKAALPVYGASLGMYFFSYAALLEAGNALQ